jgi:hypothetical protein
MVADSLMKSEVEFSIKKLISYCEKENFKGWDPYDGLNSKIFKKTPFKNWDLSRLIWIQLFKRNPFNLRNFFKVPKQYNAKGIGLFLNGYCNLYELARNGNSKFGSLSSLESKIRNLSELLLELQSPGYSGACWGYNFDWQARRLFLFPASTPTVVATTFCATALFQAYEITNEERYLDAALSSSDFVLKDLSKTNSESGYFLSYSPISGNNTVFNASLLGAKLLSYCYKYSGIETLRIEARKIVASACAEQAEDGSWVYGLLPVQNWIDSFHTGYNLEAIYCYQELCNDKSFSKNLDKGLNYYINNFFQYDGTPKYYNDMTFPIDIHCPGQLLVTLSRLNMYSRYGDLANKVTSWTIKNMQDNQGFFYYQVKRVFTSKIPYMRWSNAFMFNALSYSLLEQNEK